MLKTKYVLPNFIWQFKMSRLQHLLLCIVLAVPNTSDAANAEETTHFALSKDQSVSPLERFRECDVCPEMIALPMGSFMMGAELEESAFLYSFYAEQFNYEPTDTPGLTPETPRSAVLVDIPFALGRNEVTRSEWMSCVSEGGCSYSPNPKIISKDKLVALDQPRHPVMRVSYFDALEFVDWLNAKVQGSPYRLPTEAEWEYAARAGTETKFAQGDVLTTSQANFTPHVWEVGVFRPDGTNIGRPVLVDELQAENAWGFRHMSGNVSELTQSCFSKTQLSLGKTSAYLNAATNVESCSRIRKGGAYNEYEDYLRPASRFTSGETVRLKYIGFRVLRELATTALGSQNDP